MRLVRQKFDSIPLGEAPILAVQLTEPEQAQEGIGKKPAMNEHTKDTPGKDPAQDDCEPNPPSEKTEQTKGSAEETSLGPAGEHSQPTGEKGGPKGPEPTRYGDWERRGRCIDF